MSELRQFDGGDEEEEEEGKKEEEEVKGVLMEMKGNKMKEFSPSSSLSTSLHPPIGVILTRSTLPSANNISDRKSVIFLLITVRKKKQPQSLTLKCFGFILEPPGGSWDVYF